jgi:hypothetical protein
MAHRELARLRTAVGLLLAGIWLIGLTGAAAAPDLGSEAAHAAWLEANAKPAQTDPMTTAALSSLFESASFVGPNRAMKQDRARPGVDVVEVASSFDTIRARIASLRAPMGKAPAAAPVEAPVAAAQAPAGAEIKVAALGPEPDSAALDAIDQAAAPLPKTMSSTLAYARADLPATVFDGSLTDKFGDKVGLKDQQCMAEAIYFEARGESYRGQIAVGQVVMNRVAHHLYPNTICSVVYQNQFKRNACQFSFACDGIPERVTDEKAWAQAKEVARGVILGKLYITEVGYATHYHASYVYPAWAPRMTKVTKIGMHVFYQFRRGWKFG